MDTDFDLMDDDNGYDRQPYKLADASDSIVDIREYDVPYHVRVAIDKGRLSCIGIFLTREPISDQPERLQISELVNGIRSRQSMASFRCLA